jgi:hypothetical protein
MNLVAASLVVPLGLLFIWAGAAKATADIGKLEGLALTRLLHRTRTAAAVLRSVGAIELGVGAALLLVTDSAWPRWAALGLAAGGVAYSTLALRAAAGSECGCFGTATAGPVSAGTVARAVVVALAAGATATTATSWTAAFRTSAGLALTAAAAGTACLAFLYWKELSSSVHWVRGSSSARSVRPPDCAAATVPPEVATELLFASDAWAALRPHLVSEHPVDEWTEGCWQFVCFPARHEQRDATAVFAVRVAPDAAECKGAIVIDESEELALHVEPGPLASDKGSMSSALALGAARAIPRAAEGGST